jgi:peptide/nickel transport system permease protein
MFAYIVRRIILTVPIVLGVVLITMLLFSGVAKDPARSYAGKFATERQLEQVRARMGLDKPKWVNVAKLKQGEILGAFNSQLFDVLFFRFPKSMRYDEPLWDIVKRKAPASLAVQLPAFLIIIGLELSLALWAASRRGRFADTTITVVAVLLMSVPALSVYIFAQWALGSQMRIFPVAGWESGWLSLKFAALPILITVLLGIGAGTRLYRTVVLDEIYSDYVRTARAKGVSEREVLFTHVLKNAMIPVITSTVTALPTLVLGALLLERIFQIPGLGSLMVESISNNDRPIIMGLTYSLAIVYCLLVLLSDILYAAVNPQVSLK